MYLINQSRRTLGVYLFSSSLPYLDTNLLYCFAIVELKCHVQLVVQL